MRGTGLSAGGGVAVALEAVPGWSGAALSEEAAAWLLDVEADGCLAEESVAGAAAGGVFDAAVALSGAGSVVAAGGVALSDLAAVVDGLGAGFEGAPAAFARVEFVGGCAVVLADGAAAVGAACDAGVVLEGAGVGESGVEESVWTAAGLLADGLSQPKP